MISWKPRQSDIDWTKSFFETLTDNAIWGIPMNGAFYRIDKVNHLIKLVSGPKDDLFHRLAAVGSAIGFSTVVAPETLTPQVMDAAIKGGGKRQV